MPTDEVLGLLLAGARLAASPSYDCRSPGSHTTARERDARHGGDLLSKCTAWRLHGFVVHGRRAAVPADQGDHGVDDALQPGPRVLNTSRPCPHHARSGPVATVQLVD